MSRQRGVALLQVLFLSVILSVMLIAIHTKAKAAIDLAQQLSDRTMADLKIHSADNRMKFVLLTRNLQLSGTEDGSVHWNLYDVPFSFAEVTVQIQDVSGLVSLYNQQDIKALFTFFSSAELAGQLTERLKDWQDTDNQAEIRGAEQRDYPPEIKVRNNLMQTESELQFLKGMPAELSERLQPYVTTVPQLFRNPMAMPDIVIAALFGENLSQQLLKLRQEGVLTPQMTRLLLSDTNDDEWTYLPSGTFRMTFTSEINNVKLSRRYTIRLSPHQEDPFTYWEYVNQYHAENR